MIHQLSFLPDAPPAAIGTVPPSAANGVPDRPRGTDPIFVQPLGPIEHDLPDPIAPVERSPGSGDSPPVIHPATAPTVSPLPEGAAPSPPAPSPVSHPLPHGTLVVSPGAHFNYRIIGPCCRLFDREELPWPCCRLQWRGKEPSWRRIGRRFVPDMSVKNAPSYNVMILEAGQGNEPVVMTFYHEKLPPAVQAWWYARRCPGADRA